MAEPRVAKLSGQVLWADSKPFNGYFVVGLVLPSDGAADWPYLGRGPGTSSIAVKIRIPSWFTVPIENGVFNQTAGLFFNDDMVPHNSQYQGYYYDDTLKQIVGPTTTFTVTADPTTPPIPTLTAPLTGSTTPVPDS